MESTQYTVGIPILGMHIMFFAECAHACIIVNEISTLSNDYYLIFAIHLLYDTYVGKYPIRFLNDVQNEL